MLPISTPNSWQKPLCTAVTLSDDKKLALANGLLEKNDFSAALPILFDLVDGGSQRANVKLKKLFNNQEFFAAKYDVLKRFVDRRFPAAYMIMGCLYQSGVNGFIPKDDAQSVRFLQMAANLGNPSAIYNLGCAYLRGEGVVKDFVKAYDHFARAAKFGLPEAHYNLAYLYLSGVGTEQSTYMAQRHFRIAFDKGMKKAERYLFINCTEKTLLPSKN